MDSKKKPFWLVFENYDDGADDVLIIFKSGDGQCYVWFKLSKRRWRVNPGNWQVSQ